MRKLMTIFLVVLLAGCTYTQEPINEELVIEEPVVEEFEEPEPKYTGTIDEPLKEDIMGALEFLKEHKYDKYVEFCKYVKYVWLVEDDGKYFAYSNPLYSAIYFSKPIYDVKPTDPGDFLKIEWIFPLTLVHEVTHIVEFNKNPKITIYETEKAALAAEREFFRAMGVDEETIEEVAGEHLLETRWWEN